MARGAPGGGGCMGWVRRSGRDGVKTRWEGAPEVQGRDGEGAPAPDLTGYALAFSCGGRRSGAKIVSAALKESGDGLALGRI